MNPDTLNRRQFGNQRSKSIEVAQVTQHSLHGDLAADVREVD